MRHEPTPENDADDVRAPSDEEAIRDVVARLSRPHKTGGRVIERASLLSAGSDFAAALAWIEANGGEPEAPPAAKGMGGLHAARSAPADPTPLRFIIPAGALS